MSSIVARSPPQAGRGRRRSSLGLLVGQRDPVRAPRRLPNDSIVVARFVGVLLAARDREAVACVAAVFLVGARFVVAFAPGALVPGAFVVAFAAGAFFAAAFFAGAFFAAVALAVGRRVGVVVAETAFLRATRALVGVGFPPGVFAAVAPVARFAAVATFFAATLPGGGALPAPVCFLDRAACAIVAPRESAVGDGLPGAPAVKRTCPTVERVRGHEARVAKTMTLSTYSPLLRSNRPPQVIRRSLAVPPEP
ncbi:hypothetical protein [Micromonospora sp. WMMD1082]|uniref:hypothetical protein n=1 Tax=Micromonospora sp. WMMD1082 TaxID=3016104 RepID=UPI002416B838|nr:hypothetical protein [Micromonospora sp. WMMD1082]MDG4797611.1 hypothetical protein [Micromonospora sp. WMMD1082]